MPRLVSALPAYRKHRASGQAVVTIAGRDVYLGPHGTKASKREYDRLIGEWIAAGRPTTVVGPKSEITLTEIIAAYWRHAKEHYVKDGGPTKQQGLIKLALGPVRTLYGGRPAAEFGPLALKAVREHFVAAGLSRSTVNGHVQRIKLVFKWAASEELIPASVHQQLATVSGLRKGKTAARESVPVQPVPDADVEATLPHLPPMVADMVRLQRLSGMRPGEVCIVRPADVDRTGDVWRYVPERHKTEHHDRERVIFFGPKAQAILLPYLDRDADAYCFSPKESEAERRAEQHRRRKTPVSCGNRPGTNRGPKRAPLRDHYPVMSYRQAIRRAANKAGVPVWKPNQLRHTAATAVRRVFGLEGAQVMLGHANADVTQVYAERDAALGERIAREQG